MRNCNCCSKEYEPKIHNSKYCPDCRESGAYRRKGVPFSKPRLCGECGESFVATGKNQKYCSKACASPRKYHLQKTYGISLRQHKAIEDSLGKSCMICGAKKNVPAGKRGRNYDSQLCIDHDHETGNIRGLLCNPCNTALGQFKDSQEVLVKAISYLREASHREKEIKQIIEDNA